MNGSSDQAVASLLAACRSRDPDRQVPALVALTELEAVDAGNVVDAVVAALHSADPGVRFAAAESLARLGTHNLDSAGQALVASLTDPAEIVRTAAAEALGEIRYTPAVDVLRVALTPDPSFVVRSSAAESLGDLQDSRALPELRAALADDDEVVRGYAARSIGMLADRSMLSVLHDAVASGQHRGVRMEIWAACYRLGEVAALARFVQEVADADEILATVWLNVLEDVLEFGPAESLAGYAAGIAATLQEITQKYPIEQRHVERLSGDLARASSPSSQAGSMEMRDSNET